jgi:putative flippase GtrA
MGKSYLDYDKVTWKDVVLRYLKVCGLALGGALVGCIPVIVVINFFDWESYLLYFLAGVGAMIFYGIFFQKEDRRWYDHFGIVIFAFLGTLIGQIVNYFIYYAPQWVSPAFEKISYLERTIRAYFIAPVLDGMSSGKLMTDDGSFSVWTVYFISLAVVLIGIYVTFLFVLASDDSEKNKKH